MTSTRDLDYSPLRRGATLRALLGAARSSNLLVMAGTVGVLLVLVPLVVFVALVATGNATDVGGLVVLAMCFGGGCWVLFDLGRRSVGADAFESFARANDLTLVRASTVQHYAGSVFADGSFAVDQSVRTADRTFVEVGDRFPTTAASFELHGHHRPNRLELFLRARLSRSPAGSVDDIELISPDLLPAALHDELSRFAGAYRIEVSGDELTLFGTRGLEVRSPARVREAFDLLDALLTELDPTRGPSSGAPAPEGGPGRPAPDGGTPGPLRVVAWTLALVVVGPIAIAIVFSVLDDHLRGNRGVARLAVGALVVVVLAVVGRVVRAALTPRRTDRGRPAAPPAEPGTEHR